jgi:hypothetical protein
MIRFACPRCKTVLERPEHESGTKLFCPGCQQRLQVPAPPENKTILGDVLLPTASPAEPMMGIKVVPLPDVPLSMPTSPPPPPMGSGARVQDGWDDADDRPRRSPRADRDRDLDDFDIERRPRGGRSGYDTEASIRSATVGFWCSMVGVGLIFTGMLLWLVMVSERRPFRRDMDPFVFVILALGLVSFVLGLVGTIFSGRGLDPSNTQNRGLAIAGLICGILGMIVGLIGSLIFFCIGMFIMALPR